jgi:pilus assembly protein CpaC
MKRLWIIGLALFGTVRVDDARAAEPKPLIQIGAEVVEVDEQKAQNLGVQWLNTLHVAESSVPSLLSVGTLTRDVIFADLQFLEQEGAADLLANPKLVARDGASATFHAGGEIPYASSGSQGSTTVTFKEYGVDLKITPHLNSQGLIEMTVEAGVSGPDMQNQVSLSGNVVPGIRARHVSSEITLAPGSTLTLAGLIQDEKEVKRDGIPGLLHVPLLNVFFSHKVMSHHKTSIVVFVTPTVLEYPKAPATAVMRPAGPVDDLLKIEDQKDMEPSHG